MGSVLGRLTGYTKNPFQKLSDYDLSTYELYKRFMPSKIERYRQEYLGKKRHAILRALGRAGASSLLAAGGYAKYGPPGLLVGAFAYGSPAITPLSDYWDARLARAADRYAAKRTHPLDVAAGLSRTHRKLLETDFEDFGIGSKELHQNIRRVNAEEFLDRLQSDFGKVRTQGIEGLANRLVGSAFDEPRVPYLWSRIKALQPIAARKGLSRSALLEPVEEGWEKLKRLRQQAEDVLYG